MLYFSFILKALLVIPSNSYIIAIGLGLFKQILNFFSPPLAKNRLRRFNRKTLQWSRPKSWLDKN